MKTFKSYLTLLAFVSLFGISCQKTENFKGREILNENSTNSTLVQTIAGNAGSDLVGLTYCNAKVVPICAGQTINVGEVSVQTAIDGRTIVTYSLKSNWYFQEIHLFLGAQEDIPVSGGGSASPGQFPYKAIFNLSDRVQKYTFVISGLPELYTVAAHCSLAKLAGNGTILQQETGWGDGCTGKKITDKGAWGTFVNYTGATCTLASAANENTDICSRPSCTYFGIHPSYDMIVPWDIPSVEIGGINYFESEGRAIANTPDVNGVMADSKACFMSLATLKLSGTDYTYSATLVPAAETIETWLASVGKLSPTNLPTGNSVARNASSLINQWINSHNCPERR
jgi:hypothetical protein